MSFKKKFDNPDDEYDTLEPVNPSARAATRTAPTIAEVKAYWAQGRRTEEAMACMEQYKTQDAVSGADLYYIPERHPETLEEMPAPTDLTGQTKE